MELDDLIAKTRELVGDVEHEGNTTAFTKEQVIVALNLAQCDLAGMTRCTYMEADTAIDEDGLIDFLNPVELSEFGVMAVDRVRTVDPVPVPVSTITTSADTYALADSPVLASVDAQTDATYLWSAAGATISGSNKGSSVSLVLTKAGTVFLACTVAIHGTLVTGTKTLTITET